MRCRTTLFYQQIDNDLSVSRNVSSNKMIHVILALVFFDKNIVSAAKSKLLNKGGLVLPTQCCKA